MSESMWHIKRVSQRSGDVVGGMGIRVRQNERKKKKKSTSRKH
jgi:hypothetical protein